MLTLYPLISCFSVFTGVQIREEWENTRFSSTIRDTRKHAPETRKSPIKSGFFGRISFLFAQVGVE